MELSVVILNYNVRYFLELCLESVLKATESIEAEIIVVDNDSQDDSVQMVQSLFPKVTLLKNTSNLGFSKGNNVGVANANGKYICILNPDTIVAESTFSELLHFASQKNNLGIVGSKLIDGRGRYLPESKRNIPLPRIALKKFLGYSEPYYANQINKNEIGEVDILVGAFMFMPRSVYNTLGGFDEDYFMYGEDIDISYRSLLKGYDNFYYGKLRTLHFKGESTLKDTEYAKRFYGAMKIFYKKHFKKNYLFDLTVSLGISLAHIMRKVKQSEIPIHQEVLVYTKRELIDLSDYYSKVKYSEFDFKKDISPMTMVVYDLGSLCIDDVLEHMEANMSVSQVLYRFLSRDETFILGSDSSINRGEIIKLTS